MANKGVKGRVVDAETGAGIGNLTVTAVDFDPFFNEDDILASGKTGSNGDFQLSYSEDKYRLWKADRNPDIVVQVYSPDGRLLFETPEVEGITDETLDVQEIKIHKNNIEGWLVTNATLNPESGAPVTLYQGNEIRHLVDGDAMFPAATEAASEAQRSIDLMTLFFDVDNGLITQFVDGFHPLSPPQCKDTEEESLKQVTKATLEEVLKEKAQSPDSPQTGIPVNVLVTNIPLSANDTVSEVREFFEGTDVKTSDFNKGLALLHAKAIIQDGEKAILMGSPLKQSYFSGPGHNLMDTRHKGSLMHDVSIEVTGPAVFDISKTFASVWKATGKPLETETTSVITERQGDNVAAVQVLRTLPGGTFKPEDFGNEDLPHGETGILEAYQRAISLAERYIYLENQYFTSPDIVNALINRMKDDSKPKLQIIIVLNFRPDLPGYPDHQIQIINQLKIAAEANGHQLGVYTLWSRSDKDDGTGGKEFEIMPVYVHSKLAIIDDTWATVGSANLDGTSLNYHQIGLLAGSVLAEKLIEKLKLENDFGKFLWDAFWSIVLFILKKVPFTYLALAGLIILLIKAIIDFEEILKKLFDITETIGEASEIPDIIEDVFARTAQHALPNRSRQPSRSVELNVVLYNGIAGQPASPVIQQLRSQLWQEHLGMDSLPANMQDVPAAPAEMNWVETWNNQASQHKDAIKDNQAIPDPAVKILEWVPETNAKDYLAALEIRKAGLRSKAYKYDFKKCKYIFKKDFLPYPIPWLP